MDDHFVRIGKAAKLIGMRIEDLHKGESAGILVPIRTLSNQRMRGGLTHPHDEDAPHAAREPAVSSSPESRPKNSTVRGTWIVNAGGYPRCGAAMGGGGRTYRWRERIKRKTTRSASTPRLGPARTCRDGGRRRSPRTVCFRYLEIFLYEVANAYSQTRLGISRQTPANRDHPCA